MERSRVIDLYPAIDFSPYYVSDERKFVIMCARVEMPEWMRKEAGLFASGEDFDWVRVLELAEAYRVAPLVYGNVQGLKVNVPHAVAAELRNGSLRTLAGSARLLAEVGHLSALFKGAGIEALFTKGAAFLADIYTTPGVRGLSDIDILVRERDFDSASRALEGDGLRLREEAGTFSGYRTQRLYEASGRVPVDLHMGFIGRRLHDEMLGIDWENVWRRKRELVLNGARIYTLDISHTIIYACVHLAVQHALGGLIWYVDLHEFIQAHSGGIDWDEVANFAEKYRVRKPVYHALFLTKGIMGAPIPQTTLDVLAQSEGKLDKWALRRIKGGNREVDYVAELFMFDSFFEASRFAVLSVVRYPCLVGHFFKVLGRLSRGLVSRG